MRAVYARIVLWLIGPALELSRAQVSITQTFGLASEERRRAVAAQQRSVGRSK